MGRSSIALVAQEVFTTSILPLQLVELRFPVHARIVSGSWTTCVHTGKISTIITGRLYVYSITRLPSIPVALGALRLCWLFTPEVGSVYKTTTAWEKTVFSSVELSDTGRKFNPVISDIVKFLSYCFNMKPDSSLADSLARPYIECAATSCHVPKKDSHALHVRKSTTARFMLFLT